MSRKIKLFIRNNRWLMLVLSFVYRAIYFNTFKMRRQSKVVCKGAFCKRLKVTDMGSANTVLIGEGCRIYNSKIICYGTNNLVDIKHDCVLNNVNIWVSRGSTVAIKNNTYFENSTHLAGVEGRTISVGENCLFAHGITVRTGDSHLILDEQGDRINPSADVTVGAHSWIGQNVMILKGATIGRDTIVGAGAIVTGKSFPDGVVLAGTPAKVVKEHVTWQAE